MVSGGSSRPVFDDSSDVSSTCPVGVVTPVVVVTVSADGVVVCEGPGGVFGSVVIVVVVVALRLWGPV